MHLNQLAKKIQLSRFRFKIAFCVSQLKVSEVTLHEIDIEFDAFKSWVKVKSSLLAKRYSSKQFALTGGLFINEKCSLTL